MQVHREGDGHFEVRVRMDPNWLSQHGGANNGREFTIYYYYLLYINHSLAAPLIEEEDDGDEDDGEVPPLDLWAPTDKIDTKYDSFLLYLYKYLPFLF